MKKIIALLVATLMLLAGGLAIGAPSDTKETGGIVVTDFPCYELVRTLTGTDEGIGLLIRPGTDTHMYEPTPADAMALHEAEMFFYIGGHGDGWADDILRSVDGVTVVRMMDSVEALEEEHDHDHDHGEHEDISYDEHIWTSPSNMRAMLRHAEAALSEKYPENAATYRANADAYDAELQRLDAAFREVVDSAMRDELVFADRFPFLYFAHEYGLSHRSAFAGCADDVQPSVQAVASLIDAVREDKVPVIYVIEMSTGDIARAIREQTGAEIVELHSCQNVTQQEFEAGETYLSIMWRNVEALKKGLH